VEPDEPILLNEPTPEMPFVAKAALRPATAHRGNTLMLIIEAKTAPGWHIYAANGPREMGTPTSISVKLPEGVVLTGPWEYSKTVPGQEGKSEVYEGRLIFRRSLQITEKVKRGTIEVQCELTYEACDPFHCRPPETLPLSAAAEV